MIFVVVSWVLGLGLAVAFISSGIARLTGDRRMLRRKNHLGVDDELYTLVAAAEIVAGSGLVLGTLSGPVGAWPALFHNRGFLIVGAVSAVALIGLKAFSISVRRRIGDDFNDNIPAMISALLCVAFLIAFSARQLLLA